MNKLKRFRLPRPSQKKVKRKKDFWWSWPWFSSTWSKVGLAAGLFLVAFSSFVFITAYYRFSRMIDRKISGEVFQNTAKVYAAPLIVFPGQVVRPWYITNYLKKVGYLEKGKGSSRMGEYNYTKQGLDITPHDGSYYGSAGPRVRIEFDEKSVSRISSLADKTNLNSYEVEPQLITNL